MKNLNSFSITFLVFLILVSFLFTSFSSAQTTTPDFQAVIKQLQEQIKLLNQQIAELQSSLKETQKEVEIVKTELKLTKSLKKGETSDEVRQLQQFLKQFPDIYPEGIVTGFFGSLTEKAVKRFQEKNGIESIGIVGPKTLQKLNEFSVSATPAIPAVPAIPGVLPAIPAVPASPSLPLVAFTPLAQPATVSAVVPTSTIPSALASPSSTKTLTPTPSYTPTPYESSIIRITANSSNKNKPAISGNKIIWLDNRHGTWDIFMYDLATKAETRITSNPGDERDPDISGDYVVYQVGGVVYLYNITTGATTRVGGGIKPKIDGNNIVYSSYPMPSYIYLYDILTGKTKLISTKGSLTPYISGNDLVYTGGSSLPGNQVGGAKIYHYNLISGIEREIIFGNIPYEAAVFNGRIAYMDRRDGGNQIFNMYVYDLNTNTEKKLTNRTSATVGMGSISISGNQVFWIDIDPYRNEAFPRLVYLYDLSTNQLIQITSGLSIPIHLSIDGSRLVWVDDKNANYSTATGFDIYYLDLSTTKSPAPIPTPTLTPTPIPASTSTSAPTVSTSPSPTASVSYSPTPTPIPIPTSTPTSILPSNLVAPIISPFRWGSWFNKSDLIINGAFKYNRTVDTKAFNVYVQYPDLPGTFTKYTYSVPAQDYVTVSGNDATTLYSGVTSWQWSTASRPANTFSLGTYRFYVAALGTDDKEGPKSELFENTLSAAPAITSPANGATVAFPITITLSQTKAGEYYKYTIWGGSTMYYESPYTQSASITVNSVSYLVNGNTYQIFVSSYDNSSGGSSINKQPTVESSFILGIPTPTPTPTPLPTPPPTSSVSFSPFDSSQISAMANMLNAVKSIVEKLNNLLPLIRR